MSLSKSWFPKTRQPITSKICNFLKCQKCLKHTQRIVFDHYCLCKCSFAFVLTFLTPDVDHVRPKVALLHYQTNRYQRIDSRFGIYALWSIGSHGGHSLFCIFSCWKIRSKVSLLHLWHPCRAGMGAKHSPLACLDAKCWSNLHTGCKLSSTYVKTWWY